MGIDGVAGPIVHTGTRFIDIGRSQPSSAVPPGARLTETAYPASLVSLAGNRWLKNPIPPVELSASSATSLQGLRGAELKLFLRLLIDEKKVDHSVVFKITEVFTE